MKYRLMSEDPKKYKKYILFAFESYYPSGGIGDVVGSYDTPEDAAEAYRDFDRYDDCEIIDRDTWEEVDFPFCS